MESVFPNIDSELKKRNIDYRDLARVAGVNELQMYRRLKGHSKWQLLEAARVCRFFDNYDIDTLFARR